LFQVTLQLFQFASNRYGVVFAKPVKKFKLGGGTGSDFFNLILAKNVCAEDLISIERNRNSHSGFVQNLDRVVSPATGGIPHISFGSHVDRETAISEIGFHQTLDRPVPLLVRLLVGHQPKAEPKKLEGGGFASPSPADQAVQPVSKLQLSAPKEAAGYTKTQHLVMGGLLSFLSGHDGHRTPGI